MLQITLFYFLVREQRRVCTEKCWVKTSNFTHYDSLPVLAFDVYKLLAIFFPPVLFHSLSISLPQHQWICLPLFEDVSQTSGWQGFMCLSQYISNKPGLDGLNPNWCEIKLMWIAWANAVANFISSTQSPWLLTQHMRGFVTATLSLSLSLISSHFPAALLHTLQPGTVVLISKYIILQSLSSFHTCCSSKAFKGFQMGQQRKKRNNLNSAFN